MFGRVRTQFGVDFRGVKPFFLQARLETVQSFVQGLFAKGIAERDLHGGSRRRFARRRF